MSKQTKKAAAPLTREQLLERIKRPLIQREIEGVGIVRFRRLSAEQRYMLQAYASDNMAFAARAIIAGFEEPKFLPEDEESLKSGAFGPVMAMSQAVLEDTEITEDELVK